MTAHLTRAEVAQYLGVTTRTVLSWDAKQILKPIKIGGKVYYLKNDVEKLFQGKEVSNG